MPGRHSIKLNVDLRPQAAGKSIKGLSRHLETAAASNGMWISSYGKFCAKYLPTFAKLVYVPHLIICSV